MKRLISSKVLLFSFLASSSSFFFGLFSLLFYLLFCANDLAESSAGILLKVAAKWLSGIVTPSPSILFSSILVSSFFLFSSFLVESSRPQKVAKSILFLWGCKQTFDKMLNKHENAATIKQCLAGMLFVGFVVPRYIVVAFARIYIRQLYSRSLYPLTLPLISPFTRILKVHAVLFLRALLLPSLSPSPLSSSSLFSMSLLLSSSHSLSLSALERLDTEGKLVAWLASDSLPVSADEMCQLRGFLERCVDK